MYKLSKVLYAKTFIYRIDKISTVVDIVTFFCFFICLKTRSIILNKSTSRNKISTVVDYIVHSKIEMSKDYIYHLE